jgi:NADP-dependent 3-hydroxy acid dehydrogenase YdfG
MREVGANHVGTAFPSMDIGLAAEAVVTMAQLPLEANIQNMTIMATTAPFIGRG